MTKYRPDDGKVTTTPRRGPFRGCEVFTDAEGYGIFTRSLAGGHVQHTGTGQTPRFRTPRQLAAWLRRHYSYQN